MFSTFPIKGGKAHRSVVQVRGKPVQAEGKTPEIAEQRLLDKLTELNKNTPSLDMTVEKMLDLYIVRCEQRKRAKSTIDDYRRHANGLKEVIGKKKVGELSVLDVEAALEELPDKAAINRRALLRAAINKIARKAAPALPNVAELVEPPEYHAKGARPFVEDEFDRFLAAEDDPQAVAMWMLLADTGLRPDEGYGLRWPEIYRSKGGWCIRLEEAKTEESKKPIPISDAVEDLLRRVTRHAVYVFPSSRRGTATKEIGPLNESYWRRKFKATATRAKLNMDRLSPYSLRHTFANVMRKKASQEIVQRLMRHTDPRTTRQYYFEIEEDELRRAKE